MGNKACPFKRFSAFLSITFSKPIIIHIREFKIRRFRVWVRVGEHVAYIVI